MNSLNLGVKGASNRMSDLSRAPLLVFADRQQGKNRGDRTPAGAGRGWRTHRRGKGEQQRQLTQPHSRGKKKPIDFLQSCEM